MMIYDTVIYVNWIALRFTANTRTLCILTELRMSSVNYLKLKGISSSPIKCTYLQEL